MYMLLIFSFLSTLAFYTNERLRMYVDPTFILIASYGLSELFRLIKHVKEHKLYSVSSEGTIA